MTAHCVKVKCFWRNWRRAVCHDVSFLKVAQREATVYDIAVYFSCWHVM